MHFVRSPSRWLPLLGITFATAFGCTTTTSPIDDEVAGGFNPRSGARDGGADSGASTEVTPGQQPIIESFAPGIAVVAPNATFSLSWSARNATVCTPAQGETTAWSNAGSLLVRGSQLLVAPASPGVITFRLTCTNDALQEERTTQITVQAAPLTDGGVATPPCTPKYTNGTVVLWDSVFEPWPAFGVRKRISVPYDGYVAFQFTASQTPNQFGSVATADYPGDGDGNGSMSISREPGCFDPALLDPRCLAPISRFVSVGWANGAAQYSCNLVPGQTYYVNLTYGGTTASATGPFCPGGAETGCGADMQNQIQ